MVWLKCSGNRISYLGGLEFFFPGVTQLGRYAIYVYVLVFCALIVISVLLFEDLRSLGYAITLVNKYGPEKRVSD